MNAQKPEFFAGDLFGELYQSDAVPARRKLREFVPGLLLCATASLAAATLSDTYGFPVILLGLLIGLALSFVSEVEVTAPGLDFASRHFLRAGIVLLGLQVTFAQVGALGWAAFGGLLLVMAGAFAAALVTARMVGEGREAGVLAGGATAICGASAALALYGVIGRERLDQARFSVTLVGIAVASAIAMLAYPTIARIAGFTDAQAGFLIGAAVHDAAQAIGGGYSYSDAAGASTTVVKLARVAMLGPIVMLAALWLGAADGSKGGSIWQRVAMPWFIAGFFAVLVVNSLVTVPAEWRETALDISKGLLLAAVTATAMRSRMALVLAAGWKPLLPVAVASLVSFVLAFVVALSVV
ncbi:putative sulfate exporter family transporter [Citromicrobium bathyomarinum]|uniref:YeiH family protein n=1 Tax=Citromicrobium bathyomarinum TaxID=72174 RepID=UPI00315B124F